MAPEKKRLAVLSKLHAAMLAEDELLIRLLMKEYAALVDDPKNDPDLKKARELFDYLQMKRRK